jgi:hypothetical protein
LLLGEGQCDRLITRPEVCDVPVYDLETSTVKQPKPEFGCYSQGKILLRSAQYE